MAEITKAKQLTDRNRDILKLQTALVVFVFI
ncbi:hypothetical protein Desca_1978 [Desulfotomaculum nigrificans CO-1-SRB]|uniref:Uncharacterized protein n=1 Tax=Desulfotomaculum nigrificans (strain DSM 14880 / VKM B-2319 / CO-1-SRB) TaxID=868595 RepID=F6B947_DESCC|nr:hypothetical protein Desca_1978 [Desulfotomaculum nigrificans CO-1-SRB]